MAGLLSFEEAEVKILLHQNWLRLYGTLEKEPENFPVLASVMQMTIKENGLASASAETTMGYFMHGQHGGNHFDAGIETEHDPRSLCRNRPDLSGIPYTKIFG